jgi:hypothetical protein
MTPTCPKSGVESCLWIRLYILHRDSCFISYKTQRFYLQKIGYYELQGRKILRFYLQKIGYYELKRRNILRLYLVQIGQVP